MGLKRILLALLGVIFYSSLSFAGAYVIIVNKDNVVDDLGLSDLKKMYHADKQRWKGGKSIVLTVQSLKSDPMRKLLEVVYEKSEMEYRKYWLRKVFRGDAQEPKKLNSALEVISFVSENSGAIGIIKIDELNDSVKAISIDGHHHGNGAYLSKINR